MYCPTFSILSKYANINWHFMIYSGIEKSVCLCVCVFFLDLQFRTRSDKMPTFQVKPNTQIFYRSIGFWIRMKSLTSVLLFHTTMVPYLDGRLLISWIHTWLILTFSLKLSVMHSHLEYYWMAKIRQNLYK